MTPHKERRKNQNGQLYAAAMELRNIRTELRCQLISDKELFKSTMEVCNDNTAPQIA